MSLTSNNTSLNEILAKVRDLPVAGGGESGGVEVAVCDLSVDHSGTHGKYVTSWVECYDGVFEYCQETVGQGSMNIVGIVVCGTLMHMRWWDYTIPGTSRILSGSLEVISGAEIVDQGDYDAVLLITAEAGGKAEINIIWS